MRVLPEGVTADGRILLSTRAARGLVDGLVSVALPLYLEAIGLDGFRTGCIVAGTLAGSAALTLAVGLRGYAIGRRRLLQLVALLMVGTGVGFAVITPFPALLLVAVIGTINPSGGDVSVFLPTEQALLPATAPDRQRTAMFARYALLASFAAAIGSLAAGLPDAIKGWAGWSERTALRSVFVVYALVAVMILFGYRRLSPAIEPPPEHAPTPLGESRPVVYRLAALFSLDAFGSGFVVQALLALYFLRRYDFSLRQMGALFFTTSLLSAASGLAAPWLANRIGLIRTMVYTHLPANALLMATALMPNARLAVACLLGRSLLSQMDVPARTSYVMAIVKPAERAAAASVTNVPRSLASVVPPLIAGWMLDRTTFGWPLLIGGLCKAVYDLVLLQQFRHLRPPEERESVA